MRSISRGQVSEPNGFAVTIFERHLPECLPIDGSLGLETSQSPETDISAVHIRPIIASDARNGPRLQST